MTTEDDFQRALDANPDDWQTRLVLADFLEERGDVRAEGYRALGMLRLRPRRFDPTDWTWHPDWLDKSELDYDVTPMPSDWFRALPAERTNLTANVWPLFEHKFATRREVEDAAALAFSRLPASRRAELLQLAPV